MVNDLMRAGSTVKTALVTFIKQFFDRKDVEEKKD